jgi:hypothetical protein
MRTIPVIWLAGYLVASPSPAGAQTWHVSAGLAGDVRHTSNFDAAGFSANAAVGVFVNDRFSLELELVRPAPNRTHIEQVQFLVAPASADEERNPLVTSRREYRLAVPMAISGLVARHLHRRGRYRVGLLGGVSVQLRQDRVVIALPELPISGSNADRLQRSGRTRVWRGLSTGADLAIAVTPRLAIVPQLRFDWWGVGDSGPAADIGLRSGVSAQWSF